MLWNVWKVSNWTCPSLVRSCSCFSSSSLPFYFSHLAYLSCYSLHTRLVSSSSRRFLLKIACHLCLHTLSLYSLAYWHAHNWLRIFDPQFPIPAYSIITPCQRANKIGVFCIHADGFPSRENNRLRALIKTLVSSPSHGWSSGDKYSLPSIIYVLCVCHYIQLTSTAQLLFGYYSFWILQCLLCDIDKYMVLALLGPALRLRYVW